jgi:hypothetical protein
MKIGSDFDKIEFEISGIHFMDPIATISDIIIFLMAFTFFLKLRRKGSYFNLWANFFLCIGISFLTGGFGHLFFYYWGLVGKSTSWFIGIIAPYFVEQAMLSLSQNERKRAFWKKMSTVKTILFFLAEIIIMMKFYKQNESPIGMIIPSLSAIIGLGFWLGILAWKYQHTYHRDFKYLWLGSLVLFPNAIIQILKINPHQWFDRNALSHILILIGFSTYFVGLRKLQLIYPQLDFKQIKVQASNETKNKKLK